MAVRPARAGSAGSAADSGAAGGSAAAVGSAAAAERAAAGSAAAGSAAVAGWEACLERQVGGELRHHEVDGLPAARKTRGRLAYK